MEVKKSRKIIRVIELVPFYIISLAILLLPSIQSSVRLQVLRTEFSAVAQAQSLKSPSVVSGNTQRILVPKLGINLPVREGKYNSNAKTWDISNDAAYHIDQSPQPNTDSGNTIIYGHDIDEVFKSTVNLAPGDEVVVYTDNNLWFKYRYQSANEVKPTDTQVLHEQDGNKLTLITCSGVFYQHRRLMTFNFESYGSQ